MIAKGDTEMTPQLTESTLLAMRATDKASVHNLTKREIIVLSRLTPETTLEQIATSLYVTRNTVKTQLRNAYRKLGINTREQAIHWTHKTIGETK